MKADLHNHTIYSDGIKTCRELVDLAVSKGLDVIALTDHDSVFGVDEAYEYGKTQGLYVLKGMELSTFHKGQTVHIVALFKENVMPKEMYEFSKSIIDGRINRARKMMENIERIFNVNVNYDLLFKNSTIITRGNMFRCILESNPGIDIKDANFMVSNDSPAYIPSGKTSTLDGLNFLHQYGALCILAHPTDICDELKEEIIALGFDGIESRYPTNKAFEEEYFDNLANKYNLFKSAGSDYHGDQNHAMIGTCTLNSQEFDVIKQKLNLRM